MHGQCTIAAICNLKTDINHLYFRRELELKSGEKYLHSQNKKKLRPSINKSGRIQKKCNNYHSSIRSHDISADMLSTSPDSPIHAGAAAPRTVVRANPLFQMEDDLSSCGFSLVSSGEHLALTIL